MWKERTAAAVLAAVAAALIGVVVSGPAGATGTSYVSQRYHYALAFPKGWMAVPATRTLAVPEFPDAEGTGTDRYLSGTPDRGMIGIAAERIGTHETLAAWARSRISSIYTQYGCTSPHERHRTLGGVAAVELVYTECFGYFDDIELVHGGRGYDVYWLGELANGGDRVFQHTLAGFRLNG